MISRGTDSYVSCLRGPTRHHLVLRHGRNLAPTARPLNVMPPLRLRLADGQERSAALRSTPKEGTTP
jgi:hypothetical protein